MTTGWHPGELHQNTCVPVPGCGQQQLVEVTDHAEELSGTQPKSIAQYLQAVVQAVDPLILVPKHGDLHLQNSQL